MQEIRCNMSVSVDGYVSGPEHLDAGFYRVQDWVGRVYAWRERQGMAGGERNPDNDVAEAMYAGVGAYVMGRRTFDVGEEPWGETPPFQAPVFVVTHRPRDVLERKGGTSFTFVTDGLASAIDRARDAAGDADVAISGGPGVVRQALAAGLIDDLQLHVAPVLLGDGMRLFDRLHGAPIELERRRVVDSPDVTHLRYRPRR